MDSLYTGYERIFVSVILPLSFYPFGVYLVYLFATSTIPNSILEAAHGMTYDSVMEALVIAHDYCAHTPQYLVASIETQRAHPERRFESDIDPKVLARAMAEAKQPFTCPHTGPGGTA